MEGDETGTPVGDTAPSVEPSSTTEAPSGNPAWQEILGTLPDSLHSTVRPALEKWDTNYQQGIQKVHSQYEPYKEFIDAGFEPQTIQYALAILDKMENEPRTIYDSLGEHYGYAGGQGQPESDDADDDYDADSPVDPRLERAEKMSEAVAEYVMQQHQQQQDAQEDAELDREINSLRTKHGIDAEDTVADKFVMGLMLAGASPEEAFNEYVGMQTQLATRARPNDSAPTVMGSGGGVPTTQIPVSELRDGKARRALVAQMIQQANQS